MPKLSIRHQGLVLKEFELAKERITIGRHTDNDIQLDDDAASSTHAVLTMKPNEYLQGSYDVSIIDFNSTNGLFVNNEKVQSARLKPGDIIRIGRHELQLDVPGTTSFEQTAVLLNEDDPQD